MSSCNNNLNKMSSMDLPTASFKNLGNPRYNYSNIKEKYYAIQGDEWTYGSNVTPDNSSIINPSKINFQKINNGYLEQPK